METENMASGGLDLLRSLSGFSPTVEPESFADSDAYAMMLYYKDLIALRKANPWLYDGAVSGEVLEDSTIAASSPPVRI